MLYSSFYCCSVVVRRAWWCGSSLHSGILNMKVWNTCKRGGKKGKMYKVLKACNICTLYEKIWQFSINFYTFTTVIYADLLINDQNNATMGSFFVVIGNFLFNIGKFYEFSNNLSEEMYENGTRDIRTRSKLKFVTLLFPVIVEVPKKSRLSTENLKISLFCVKKSDFIRKAAV